MSKKFLKKSLLLIIIFCITTPLLGQLFRNDKNTTVEGFYAEEKNSLDALFVGSSQVYCTVIPNVIWEYSGIPTYNLSQPEQPLWITYHYIKEAIKYQKPKVIVLDVLMVNMIEEYGTLANSNRNLDYLKSSINKLQAIHASVPPSDRPYYLFELLKNKSNWKDISKNNFTNNFKYYKNPNKGFLEFFDTNPYEPTNGYKTTEVDELPTKPEFYLQKIIDLLEKENIELLLIKSPYIVPEDHQRKFNKVKEIAQENDIEFIDFNQMHEELNIDFEKDFLDSYHLNFRGAIKVSEYIATYLQENYNLQDKRDDDNYNQWNADC